MLPSVGVLKDAGAVAPRRCGVRVDRQIGNGIAALGFVGCRDLIGLLDARYQILEAVDR
jgi:hypothetical protein